MSEQTLISVVAGLGFVAAGLASYPHFREPTPAKLILRIAAAIAILVQVLHLGLDVRRTGVAEAMQSDFAASVLMAMLMGAVGLGAHLSGTLRGLDGFLFGVAALLSFTATGLSDVPPQGLTARPWFISHALAFSLSATCFMAGGLAGIAYLIIHRVLRRKRASSLVGSLASLESLERFGRWMPIVGFPLFTFGILTGLCGIVHRPDLNRGAWYLDPTFWLSLIAWVVYAYLCFGSLYRPQLRGRRAAVLSTYGLGLIVVVFFVREFSSRLHQ